MFGKNLKYYRLKNNMSMKELADLVQISPMAISHYEKEERRPDMQTIKALAKALHVRVTDFLTNRDTSLVFCHGEFRKNSKLIIYCYIKTRWNGTIFFAIYCDNCFDFSIFLNNIRSRHTTNNSCFRIKY